MKKLLCIITLISILLCCSSCNVSSQKAGDLSQYGGYLKTVEEASAHMPNDGELGEYTDVQITRRHVTSFIFDTYTVGLFISYDAESYTDQKEYIASNYTFYAKDDEDLESDCDASVHGYKFRLAKRDYEWPTYKTGLLIGTDDTHHKICYLFYYDFDLDVLDDLGSYILTYFYIP